MKKNISIIGLGKLGLCFALTLEKAGYYVMGIDVNSQYVDLINEKKIKSSEKDVTNFLSKSSNLIASIELRKAIEHSNVIFVIVATPSLPDGKYDHSQIFKVINDLETLGRQEQTKHLVICCTVMPGFCNSISKRLEKINYTVSYNPEFIAQGTILKDQSSPDLVLIGECNKEVGDLLEEIYRTHTSNNPQICRMSTIEAEITKISLNCFLTTKIAYANMIGDIVEKSGGRPDVVLSSIGLDSRIGSKYLKYGFGYGGPCFPRDNRALSIYANEIGMPAEISKSTDISNKLHLNYQVESFISKNSIDKPVIFESITYKPESTMIVESQQLEFAIRLSQSGYKVLIKEKNEVIEEVKKMCNNIFEFESKEE